MAKYLVIAFLIILITRAQCDQTSNLHRRVKQLKIRNRELYGEVRDKDIKARYWNNENSLSYPRGDKQKLALLSKLWCDYYDCLLRMKETLTTTHGLPSIMHVVYKEALAKLACNLCIAPGERGSLTWTYAMSPSNLTFKIIEDKDRVVIEQDGSFTIYHVTSDDAGVYRCQLGYTLGGLNVLKVVDNEEMYNIVKPPTSRGPYASPMVLVSKSLAVFSSWSQWSECSVCGKVGRKRRYGMCYVKLQTSNTTYQKTGAVDNGGHAATLNEAALTLLEEFPGGVPCRSRYLSRDIQRMPAVLQRRSEIMIAMCKVECKDILFEIHSASGEVLEKSNNSAGIYSLSQTLPKQPDVPTRHILFADYGRPFAIRCPGTCLRDVPVTWRVGSKLVVPRHLDKASGGRVHLNARDHLIFTKVLYEDTNLYSCWQLDALAGTVKLTVWAGTRVHWNHHATLAVLVLTAGAALHVTARVLRIKRYARTSSET